MVRFNSGPIESEASIFSQMKEIVLRGFFEGSVDVRALVIDLTHTVETAGKTSHYRIEDMDGQFQITAEHLVRLCDAILDGQLDPKALETIGFCLVASDSFHWDTDQEDGNIVAQTCFEWSEPRINYALTVDNVRKFRKRLKTGRNMLGAEFIPS
jgi:hypothetical protein